MEEFSNYILSATHMRRARIALLLASTMLLAGCMGANNAEWGSGGIDVDFSIEGTTITTNLGDSKLTYEGLAPVGCESGNETVLAKNSSGTVEFTGFLSASVLYDSHDSANGVSNMDTAVTAAVAIQKMSKSDANNVNDGEGARIDVKNWFAPLMPETSAGTVDLDEIDEDTETDWYILGLIPTSENINDGFRALAEWHKPVTIHGYLLSSKLVNGSSVPGAGGSGYHSSNHIVDSDCNLIIGTGNLQTAYVLVDKIEIEDDVVSYNGEHRDEWAYGDVPFFGRAGFILFFLVVGVGGAVGMFLLSQMFVRYGAKETMKTLLGEEGLAKIKKVASDLRRNKKSGTLSPIEIEKERRKEDKLVKKQQSRNKPKSSSAESSLSGFDIESALTKGSTNGPSDFGAGTSSVVITEESMELEKQIKGTVVEEQSSVVQESSWEPPQKHQSQKPSFSNVVSSEPQQKKTEHFSSVRKDSAHKTKSAAPVKKRRAAKKRKTVKSPAKQVEPEVEEVVEKETFDDQDFSNFSL